MDTPRKKISLVAGALALGLYTCSTPAEYKAPVPQAAGRQPADARNDDELAFLYPLDGETLASERKAECRYVDGIWVSGETWSTTPRLEYTCPGEIESAHAVLTAEKPHELMRIYSMIEQMKERIDQVQDHFPEDYANITTMLSGLSREGNGIALDNFNVSGKGETQELSFPFSIPLPPGRYQLDVAAETSDGRSHHATVSFRSDI